MPTYTDEAQAAADGFTILHQPDLARFAIVRGGEASGAASGEVVGEAHYHLLGDAAINFDHTFVAPPFRGTGLSDLLAHHALTDEIVRGRQVRASCWFIREYLAAHPELREGQLGE